MSTDRRHSLAGEQSGVHAFLREQSRVHAFLRDLAGISGVLDRSLESPHGPGFLNSMGGFELSAKKLNPGLYTHSRSVLCAHAIFSGI